MILVNPPITKPCEPPAGLAKLAGVLKGHGIRYRIIDANMEGLIALLGAPHALSDTWTRRAAKNLTTNLASLEKKETYDNPDRYERAVTDINRLLSVSASSSQVHMSLSNYRDETLSPVRSQDLIRASENPERNPFYPYFKKRLCELLKDEAPSVIGFSLNYLSQALCTFAMIGFLKRIDPTIRIVCGGGLMTSWMRNPGWKNPFHGLIDHAISGPGETALVRLLGKSPSATHSRPDYAAVSGNRYLSPGFVLPYSASRGCYWNRCSFCPEKAEGNIYTPTPRTQVAEDLQHLSREMEPSLIHILDNAVSPALLSSLIDEPPGAPWYGFARITLHLTDLEFCHSLRRSGCRMLKLGLESGDQGILDEMQKGIDLATASMALHNLKKSGIATYVYLLFGTPFETEREARKTLEFTALHADTIGFLNLAIFNLPAYGPEARILDTRDFYEGDLSLYRQFTHPKGWERSLVRQFLEKEFRRHPAIAPIVKRDPPFFTSNHAPFFGMS